ncbi:MAG: hypothetical protein ACI9CF_001774 [Candidatus Omnitrophota bacterium]|jgi:hypothetical protein
MFAEIGSSFIKVRDHILKGAPKKIRTTNLRKRLFGEARRRSAVIPRFPTESSCITLMYATMFDASKKWCGVKMTVSIFQVLEELWNKTMPENTKRRLHFGKETSVKKDLQPVNG